jgi:hypothetical protein
MIAQPETVRAYEDRYDTLELIPIDRHLTLLQVSEDGESETLVIGPQQQRALLVLLQQMLGGQ